MTPNVAQAVETVASHLHPVGSFEVEDHPVPTGREEVWRFTPIRRLNPLLTGGPSDGHLAWKYDPPAGVTVRTLSTEEAIRAGTATPLDRPAALAVAHGGGAVLIDIAAETVLAEPLTIQLTGEDPERIVWGHLLLRVGPYAKAAVVFEHTGAARYASSLSVQVGEGAQLDLVSLQLWDDTTLHTGQISSRVGRDARLRSFQASLGGDVVRLVETAEFEGPGAEVELTGVYFVSGRPEAAAGQSAASGQPAPAAARRPAGGQHIEHRLFIDHNAPETRSQVDYRGALQGAGAHSVWVGDVLIRKVAEGIDTYESNRNLVLTDGCRADSVPNLEIETGEIRGAGHASATGRFDDEQVFYLMSRGIPELEARKLVVRGFFAELLGRVPVEPVRDRLGDAIEARLTEAGA
ncbi:MAG TPA: SufD family Fe-S cluster assembly protein [Natronosporangium sp.]